MQRQHPSGSSSTAPAFDEGVGQRKKTSTGAIAPHLAQVSPEDDDPMEDWLEYYGFHYILERVKKTTQRYPAIQHLSEEIASEVYDKFWQKLLKGPVHNPPGYIARMIHNKCVDYMRRHITETCHIVQSNMIEGLDILESNQALADSEGLRDPADEFEDKASLRDCYLRISVAIAKLPPKQQQAAAWYILRKAPDPLELKEVFNAYDIAIPVVHQDDRDEEHLLEASYIHARKALATSLNIDLSQFQQRKRLTCNSASKH